MLICTQPVMLIQGEIKELTCETSKDGQCRVLGRMKIPYRENPKGWPIVLRSDLEKALSVTQLLTAMDRKYDGQSIAEPDLSNI